MREGFLVENCAVTMTTTMSRLVAATQTLDMHTATLSRAESSLVETQSMYEKLDAWAAELRCRKEFEEVAVQTENIEEEEEVGEEDGEAELEVETIEEDDDSVVEEEDVGATEAELIIEAEDNDEKEYTAIEEAVTLEEEELATIDEEEDVDDKEEESEDEQMESEDEQEESITEEPPVEGRTVVPSGNFFVAFDSPDRTLGFSVLMTETRLVVDRISDVRLESKIRRGDTIVALGGETIGPIETKDRLDRVLKSIKEHPHPVVIMFHRRH